MYGYMSNNTFKKLGLMDKFSMVEISEIVQTLYFHSVFGFVLF